MPRPTTLRARLTWLVAAIVAVAVAVPLVVLNVGLQRSAARDDEARARTAAQAARAVLDVDADGRVDVARLRARPELTDRVWVVVAGRAIVRGHGEAALQRAAVDAAARRGPSELAARARLWTVALPAAVRGGGATPVGAVVAAQPTDRRRLELHLVLASSAVGGALLVGAAALVAWLALGRALRPLATATRAAEGWSERDLDRGLGVRGGTDEAGELLRAVDGLLARLASSLRQSRQLAADLSHELRTPLARIVAELDLLRRRPRSPAEQERALDVVARATEEMERIVGSLMAAARAERAPDRGRADLGAVLGDLGAAWEPAARQRGVRLVIEPPATPLPLGAPAELLGRVLGPLVGNALRHARTVVRVGAVRDGARVRIAVEDDGPGVEAEDPEELFEPGVRGAATTAAADDDGAGLGLALARRLAHGVGGEVAFDGPGRDGGARVVVDLPA